VERCSEMHSLALIHPYTGKNRERVSGEFCVFPEIFPFFSQNGRIIRKNGKISGNIKNSPEIFP